MTDAVLPAAARRIGIALTWILAAALLLGALALAWVGVRGWLAYGHLQNAQRTATNVLAGFGPTTDVTPQVDELARDTAAARELTSDPVWRAVEAAPWIGPQLSAVSTVAVAVDNIAREGLRPIAADAASFSPEALAPSNGRVDVAAIAGMHDAADQAASVMGRAAASVRSVPRTPLIAPLRDAIDDISTQLDGAASGVDGLARATALLPPMLGAEGPRDYLVLFQNNAEWRSLGGIPGAMALIHTDGGVMSLVGQDSSSGFPRFDESVLPLDPQISALYGTRPGRFIQNVTQVPEFPLAASLAREMWAREHGGQQVDGVIALDPVALSYLLKATGPVTLATGDVLASENAVPLLLNEVYLRYDDPQEQDAFFASAAASVFEALSRGGNNPRELLDALARAGDERRLLLWSSRTEDQDVLAPTTLAGGLPVTDEDVATFGVYVNDGTGSKMDYYADLDSAVDWKSCQLNPSGAVSGTATLTVTITNNAPADAADLPSYITGGGAYGVPPGTARTSGYIYLPEGFLLQDTASSTGVSFGAGGNDDDRRVVPFGVDLTPGQSATVTISALTPAPGPATLAIQSTPTIDSAGRAPSTATCAG